MHENDTNRNRNLYDSYWRQGIGSWCPSETILKEERRQFLIKHVPSSARVLDIGCGDGGHYGKLLATLADTYNGVDVSSEAVAKARALSLSAQVHDLTCPLPFSDGTFDVTVCFEVLEHLL